MNILWFVQVVSVRGQDVCYRFDPRLAKADSAGCSAYYGTDKGQLAPSGITNHDSVYTLSDCLFKRKDIHLLAFFCTVDTSFGGISRLNSFIFSNTVPQALQHKRGIRLVITST